MNATSAFLHKGSSICLTSSTVSLRNVAEPPSQSGQLIVVQSFATTASATTLCLFWTTRATNTEAVRVPPTMIHLNMSVSHVRNCVNVNCLGFEKATANR